MVSISMMSFYVYPDETAKIWEIGYSGKLAKQKQKDGNGIGMHVAKELIALNRGEFIFNPTVTGNPVSVNEILYANNEVKIKIPIALR
jgi:signal transduction histidine kinase